MAINHNKYYSITHLKCPKCHKGNLFSNNSFFVFKKVLDMPSKCPVCKQNFIIEPGFYSGALWISYPFTLLLIIPLILTSFWLSITTFFLLVFPLLILMLFILQPPIMRYSRAIWINIAVDYDPPDEKEH